MKKEREDLKKNSKKFVMFAEGINLISPLVQELSGRFKKAVFMKEPQPTPLKYLHYSSSTPFPHILSNFLVIKPHPEEDIYTEYVFGSSPHHSFLKWLFDVP